MGEEIGFTDVAADEPRNFPDGEVTFGTQWWDQTTREAKYQEFADYPNGPYIGSFVLRDALWGGQYALVGSNALRADQSTALTRSPCSSRRTRRARRRSRSPKA